MIKGHDLQDRQTTSTNGHGPANGAIVKTAPRTAGDNGTEEAVIPLETLELAAMKARIQKARDLAPPRGPEIHCGHCFGAGRRAAIAAITGEDE